MNPAFLHDQPTTDLNPVTKGGKFTRMFRTPRTLFLIFLVLVALFLVWYYNGGISAHNWDVMHEFPEIPASLGHGSFIVDTEQYRGIVGIEKGTHIFIQIEGKAWSRMMLDKNPIRTYPIPPRQVNPFQDLNIRTPASNVFFLVTPGPKEAVAHVRKTKVTWQVMRDN